MKHNLESWEKEFEEWIEKYPGDEHYIKAGYIFYDDLKEFIGELLASSQRELLEKIEGLCRKRGYACLNIRDLMEELKSQLSGEDRPE